MVISNSRPAFRLTTLVAFALVLGLILPTAATATGGTHPGGTCGPGGEHAHVSIGSPTWNEGDGTVVFTVTCDPCYNVNAGFMWSVTGGTATKGVDYTISGLNMDIGQGSSSPQTRDITVTLIDDGGFEPDETIIIGGPNSVDNGNPSVLTPCLILDPATPIGTGTIQNNDPVNSPPVANAGGEYSGGEGSPIALDGGGSTDDSGVTLYEWDCTNNGSFDVSSANPTDSTCTYPDDGSYTVKLRVTDAQAATGEDTAAVNVSNVAPTITSITASSGSINEGQAVTVSGTFTDPALASETHTGSALWSDSVATVVSVDGGTFSTTRSFPDDHPSSGTAFDAFTVAVTISDGDGGSDSATSSTVTVNNVAPTIASVSASAGSINEGQSVTVSGTFTDPALGEATETFTGTAVWSDSASSALTVNGVAGTFTTTRSFPDDHPATGTASDNFTVDITISDDDLGSDTAISPTVTVNNVAPAIGPIALSSSSIDEGDPAVTVSGTFSDPALGEATETFFGTAVWSDGQSTTLTINPGGTFSTSRSFPDDHPSTGTPSDNFTVDITINDDDLGSDTETSPILVVNNVDPTIVEINLSAASIDEGDPAGVTVTGTFTDPALGVSTETFTGTALWSDGESTSVSVDSTAGTFETSRTFPDDDPVTNTPSDVFTVDITITDDDTGTDTETSSDLTVNNVDPTITATANSASECGDTPEGTPVDVTVDFSDPGFGPAEDWAASEIDWGDGFVESATIAVTPGSFGTPTVGVASGTHTYATGGIFTITVTVTDDDTGSAQTTTTALVTGAGLTPLGLLGVVGTDYLDVVGIQKKFKTDIVVTAGFLGPGKASFLETDVANIKVQVCDGNDQIHVNNDVVIPAILDGGPGPDHVRAGSGFSMALGGPGNDHLFAGRYGTTLDGGSGDDDLNGNKGIDILLGGDGNDKLAGDKGDDMLDGGPGVDDCNPGKGTDIIINCEQ